MEIRLTGQTFYWDEVMNNSNNNDNVYNPLECKHIKGDQDSTKQKNGKTYHWCHNHNDDKGMWLVHLPEKCKALGTPNAQFQKPTKSENENQTAERGDRQLTLSENFQTSLMFDMQLFNDEVDKLLLA